MRAGPLPLQDVGCRGANLATPRQPRLVQPSAKANSFGGRTVPLRPTSGVAPAPLDSSRPNGLSDSTRAAALRRSKSQDARQLRQSSPRPQVRERQQSPRVQRPETSPRPRQASPRPVATPQRSDRQSFCRAPVTARERPKERQPSPRPVGAVTAREDRQSLVRERPTCRDRSASRQIPSPSPKSEQLSRSQSARRSLDSRSPKTDPLNRSMSRGASQRSGTHLGLRGLVSSKSASTLARAPAATGPPNPTAELPSVEELKRMIEETKKEVREIRSVESKAKWQMTREERREKLAETVAAQSELREWRWKQAQGLKQLAAQQAQAAKVSDLKESKEFVEFKRETKLRSKEVELQHQQDVYVARKADAAWQVEQAKANVEKHQAQILEKVEDVHHLRQERRSQTENEKAVAAEERALQEHLQIANLARELAKEKERLLENLELTRACMQAPIRRR
ncbi:hypothetical protein AK812_SmicGene3072 [Symbiodinium microadriaticum]|uniref:Uncharacterized protein n=1 Tax=Symbiodinium microadriaticum TaxID=2951 RepID=A0A1Q9EZY5_SYMMI|nr:hypothetical protein AK812_SmicGene3072 [Symbiodinium microadriaticum]